MQYEQMQQQQAASEAALAEQQREFDTSETNRQADLARQQAQQAENQRQADAQAALTNQWQTGRTQAADQARSDIDSAFSRFTPDYYSKFTQDYTNNYIPEVNRQYGLAKQNLLYGLARSGIGQSQSAASQQGLLAEDRGRKVADISNQAVDATTQLRNNVTTAKSNLLNTALSDQTLGSPITPGSADAISSAFDQTSRALSQARSSAGDVINTLAAPPTYSPLGNLFGSAASGVASYLSGNQSYTNYGAYGGSTPTASSPTSGSSGRVVG
jgi:hypothetical protein